MIIIEIFKNENSLSRINVLQPDRMANQCAMAGGADYER